MRNGQIVSSDGSAQTTSVEQVPLFLLLSRLHIDHCPKLSFIPLGPAVDTLILLNEAIEEEEDEKLVSCRSSNDYGNWRSDDPKIKEITTYNVLFLKSLPKVAFQCLAKIEIEDDDMVESLSEVEEVFRGCSSSMRFLRVISCLKMSRVSKGIAASHYITVTRVNPPP